MAPKLQTLNQKLDRALEKMADFKAREGRIAIGLAAIQTALKRGDHAKAREFVDVILGEDLAKAKDWHHNRAFALSIAVKAMEADEAKHRDALSHIELLAPEAFVEPPPADADEEKAGARA